PRQHGPAKRLHRPHKAALFVKAGGTADGLESGVLASPPNHAYLVAAQNSTAIVGQEISNLLSIKAGMNLPRKCLYLGENALVLEHRLPLVCVEIGGFKGGHFQDQARQQAALSLFRRSWKPSLHNTDNLFFRQDGRQEEYMPRRIARGQPRGILR